MYFNTSFQSQKRKGFVFFLLGNSPEFEFYVPKSVNNLVIIYLPAYEDGTDRVFRNVSI